MGREIKDQYFDRASMMQTQLCRVTKLPARRWSMPEEKIRTRVSSGGEPLMAAVSRHLKAEAERIL